MEWRFKKMSRDESRDKSCLVEFFNSDLFKDFTDALVREDLQNRLDAKRDEIAANEPVVVTYHLTKYDPKAAAKIAKWLAPLEKHCNSKSCRDAYHRPPLDCFSGWRQRLRYLTIECFNTTGLRGDPAGMDDADLKNDFYWMFRNQGRSGKPRLAGKRGSWGVGKVVYHLASMVNTMFCYTITKDSFALMGKCQLEPHDVDGDMYRSVGYFGNFEDDFCLPETDIANADVRAFKENFSICRDEGELGTSTVIPFCNEDITIEKLVISVIRSYLWEILKGHLVVGIQCDDGEEIQLTNDPKKLSEYIKKYFPPLEQDKRCERLKQLVFNAFYSRIIKNQQTHAEFQRYSLKEPANYRLVSDFRALFDSPEAFAEAQRDFQDEKIVEIDAAVTIEKCSGTGMIGIPATFKVFLWRKYAVDPIISLIRDGLTILKLKQHHQNAFCGLTLIEADETGKENPLSDFIRAAENPSHTELNPSREAFKGTYNIRGSKMLLDYVTELVWNLAAAFSDVNGKEDESALDDWFAFDDDDPLDGADVAGGDVPGGNSQSGEQAKKKHKKRKKTPPVVPPIPRKKPFFRIAEWDQGVKVVSSDTPASSEDLPWNLQLKFAFAAEGVAAPLKKYDLSDFDCRENGTIAYNLTGAKAVKQEPNRVVFEVTEPDFTIEMTGFGENRCDIYVEAQKIKSSEVAEGTPDENASSNDDEPDETEVEA